MLQNSRGPTLTPELSTNSSLASSIRTPPGVGKLPLVWTPSWCSLPGLDAPSPRAPPAPGIAGLAGSVWTPEILASPSCLLVARPPPGRRHYQVLRRFKIIPVNVVDEPAMRRTMRSKQPRLTLRASATYGVENMVYRCPLVRGNTMECAR